MSIEGGIHGDRQRYVCPACGKTFFSWRPDELPGARVKCYFCKHEFEDEATRRPRPAPPAAPAPAPAAPASATPDAPVT